MKKRRLILGDYDTAEDGLFTLSACKITKGSQVQSFVSVPGRYAPIDTSTLLTDGQPYYGSAALDATLESSEGTRDERLARVSGMVNALDGRSMRIIHPDHPERYLVGRVQVRPEYNDPAHCAVRVSAVCEPWLYNAQETEVQANLPHAEIHKIGGVTRKTKNLFDTAPIGTKTFIGLTYTTEGSYVKINGTKVNGNNVHPMTEPNMTLPAGTYTVSVRMVSGTITGIEEGGGVFFGINQDTYAQRTTPGVAKVGDVGVRTITLSEPTLITSFDIAPIYGSVGAVFDNAVFACQFEKSDTATEYEPYFDGLRSAPVTEVESVGVNLVDADERITDKSGYVIPPDEGRYPFKKGLYTFSFKAKNYTGGCQWQATIRDKNNAIVADSGGKYINAENTFAFTLSEQATYIDLYVNSPNGGTFYDIMLNEGSTALPYRPYQRHTLPIPEAVRPKHGINEEVYDYIDLDAKQSAERVGAVVFDGSSDENWEVRQYTNLVAYLASEEFGKIPNIVLCDRFESFIDMSPRPNGTVGIAVEGLSATAHTFFFGISGIATNVAEWRAYLAANPITVYYELATPVVTDISDLLSGTNTIPAEEGGTLTMVNPYGYEVPHEVTYYLDGESPQQVELTNAGRLAVVPVVTVKGEVTLSYGNITQTLSTGTYTLPWLYLTPDKGPLLPASHIVTCSGGGSVTFTYREAVLAE